MLPRRERSNAKCALFGYVSVWHPVTNFGCVEVVDGIIVRPRNVVEYRVPWNRTDYGFVLGMGMACDVPDGMPRAAHWKPGDMLIQVIRMEDPRLHSNIAESSSGN